jgi:arabinofuranosyltransferase
METPTRGDERLEITLRRHQWPLFLSVAVGGLVLAGLNRFVQDDAFISFVYARNLVNAEGLTWFGARVEGFTNLMWVLWIAAGLELGVDPIAWAYLGGLSSFALTLVALWRLGLALFGRVLPALLALLLFVTNYSVLCYATGGLETMLQTALLTVGLLLAQSRDSATIPSTRTAGALSLVLAAAVMTRPDSALPAMIILAWTTIRTWRRNGWGYRLTLVLPFVAIVAAWTAWRLQYYGRWFPNTFYAKTGWNEALLENGLLFLARFLHWYLLWPFLAMGILLLVVSGSRVRDVPKPGLVLLALIVLSWFAYVMAIGGDFMEFRILVPIMPPLVLLLAYLIVCEIGAALGHPAWAAVLSLAVALPMSAHHATSFRLVSEDRTLDSINQLGSFYGVYADGNWSALGEALRARLDATDPILALHAVGAIPFYSGYRTVDQLGLTDAYVARYGNPAPSGYRRPGHQRHASARYLREQGVNLIIGHPTLVPLSFLRSPGAGEQIGPWIESTVEFDPEPVTEITLLILPVDSQTGLLVWYLTPKPEIDALIAANRWPLQVFTNDSGG